MNTLEKKIDYNFYNEYLTNSNFKQKFNIRLNEIKNRFNLKLEEIDLVQEYFVEIFSWTVIPKDILILLHKNIKNKNSNIEGIIDPCCGNSFHSYLFTEFCNLKSISIDIQNEPNSWIDIIEIDAIEYLKYIDNSKINNYILLLSWIDYEELGIKLLDLYKGNIVLSIGNYYQHKSFKYLNKLQKEYKLIQKIKIKMPWGLDEYIELYFRK